MAAGGLLVRRAILRSPLVLVRERQAISSYPYALVRPASHGSTATIRIILINSCYCNLRTQIPKPPSAIFLTHANTVWDTRRRPPGARARNKSGTPAPLARHATSSSGRTGSRRLAAARMRGGLTCTSSTGSAFWPSCRTSWTSPTSRSTSLSTCRSSVRARAPPRWCRAGPPWSPPARS